MYVYGVPFFPFSLLNELFVVNVNATVIDVRFASSFSPSMIINKSSIILFRRTYSTDLINLSLSKFGAKLQPNTTTSTPRDFLLPTRAYGNEENLRTRINPS